MWMRNGSLRMSKTIEYIILAATGYAFIRFGYWCWKDVKEEKRPPVTDEMVDEAFSRMLEENDYINGILED